MDVKRVFRQVEAGEAGRTSDAYTINGQPGDFYPCSKERTRRFPVEAGKTYLLRVINAAMANGLFFAVARHRLFVIGSDGSYTRPFVTNYILISPGESVGLLLLEANQHPHHLYCMAASAFTYQAAGNFDSTTTTAILEYSINQQQHYYEHIHSLPPIFPYLSSHNTTRAFIGFTARLRSLASRDHPVSVPRNVWHRLFVTVSVNRMQENSRFSASLNNVSFGSPSIDILRAYYEGIRGVYRYGFPGKPPLRFNFTAEKQPDRYLVPSFGTEIKVLEYMAGVEVVFQGTSLVLAETHPMHLHGFSFYVVGWGFGNFDKERDPSTYKLVDPPVKNTVRVTRNGWVAIRFQADNSGMWFLHCHFEQHLTWGMSTVFIVKNGDRPGEELLHTPPPNMPPC